MHVRSTDTSFDLKQSTRDASLVRREIARLFGARPATRIVLAPGMLSGLRQLFSVERVDRLVLTSEEYYAPRHFPMLRCDVASPSALVARVAAVRPGAVVASVVSWRGSPLPVSALFGEIRRVLGARAPLLVADYTHAPAQSASAGFGPQRRRRQWRRGKMAAAARQRSRLAFLWMRSPLLFRRAALSLSPFFLAVDGRTDARSARWLNPQEVRDLAEWLSDKQLTRRALQDRHRANLHMKHRVARIIGIASDGDASVLWTDRQIPSSLESRLDRRGLLWRATDGHTRILCRDER